jgi:hypothetical protein
LEQSSLGIVGEASGDNAYKQALIDYNQQDCEALDLVTNRLVGLHRAAAGGDRSPQSHHRVAKCANPS